MQITNISVVISLWTKLSFIHILLWSNYVILFNSLFEKYGPVEYAF